jgi:hypothetical protein
MSIFRKKEIVQKKLKDPNALPRLSLKKRIKAIRLEFAAPTVEPEIRRRLTAGGEVRRISEARNAAKRIRVLQHFLMNGQEQAEKNKSEMDAAGRYFFYGKMPDKAVLKGAGIDKKNIKLMKDYRVRRLTPAQWGKVAQVLEAQASTLESIERQSMGYLQQKAGKFYNKKAIKPGNKLIRRLR